MAYYHVCEYCGSNLDPNEKCDCQKQEQNQEQKSEQKEINAKRALAS